MSTAVKSPVPAKESTSFLGFMNQLLSFGSPPPTPPAPCVPSSPPSALPPMPIAVVPFPPLSPPVVKSSPGVIPPAAPAPPIITTSSSGIPMAPPPKPSTYGVPLAAKAPPLALPTPPLPACPLAPPPPPPGVLLYGPPPPPNPLIPPPATPLAPPINALLKPKVATDWAPEEETGMLECLFDGWGKEKCLQVKNTVTYTPMSPPPVSSLIKHGANHSWKSSFHSVSATLPVAPPPAVAPPILNPVKPAVKPKKKKKPEIIHWAKGVGFGHHGQDQHWDHNQWLSSQQLSKATIKTVCEEILSHLQAGIPKNFVELIEKSCVVPYLKQTFENDSLLEMHRHEATYRAALQLCRQFAAVKDLRYLLADKTRGKSISELLDQQYENAKKNLKFSQRGSAAEAPAEGAADADILQHIVDIVTDVRQLLNDEYAASSQECEALQAVLDRFSQLSGVKSTAELIMIEEKAKEAESIMQQEKGNEEKSAQNFAQKYVSIMEPLRFSEASFASSHYYKSQSSKAVSNRKWMKRLAMEFGDMHSSLPVTPESAIYVRVDEEQMGLVNFLVIAPIDTPYSYGCFKFAAYFPSSYPTQPPKVNLMTTGRGSVRFNPNLYASGKVCLSVINTWSGQAHEKWGAHSTFLQVLLSIQSLVFVPDPYFNEPGYESQMKTAQGKRTSNNYNKRIRKGTMDWAILDMLQNPPAEFADVVKNHFYLHKQNVIDQCEEWVKMDKQGDATLVKIKEELEKLPKVD